jgi:tRNA-splicing ligase RtcB
VYSIALYALQVCTDYLSAADRAMAKAGLRLVDRQLAAAPLSSSEGRDYLAAMAAAANFAFANRCASAHCVQATALNTRALP